MQGVFPSITLGYSCIMSVQGIERYTVILKNKQRTVLAFTYVKLDYNTILTS